MGARKSGTVPCSALCSFPAPGTIPGIGWAHSKGTCSEWKYWTGKTCSRSGTCWSSCWGVCVKGRGLGEPGEETDCEGCHNHFGLCPRTKGRGGAQGLAAVDRLSRCCLGRLPVPGWERAGWERRMPVEASGSRTSGWVRWSQVRWTEMTLMPHSPVLFIQNKNYPWNIPLFRA